MRQLFARARLLVDLCLVYFFYLLTYVRKLCGTLLLLSQSLMLLALGRAICAGVFTRAAELVVSFPAVADAFNVIVHFSGRVVVWHPAVPHANASGLFL